MTTYLHTCRRVLSVLALLVPALPPLPAAGQTPVGPAIDIVAVAVVPGGRTVLLATPGIPTGALTWRFRSLDTSDIPSIRAAMLAETGTKLLLETINSNYIFDLARRVGTPGLAQYVNPSELASGGVATGQQHRLPMQRFVAIHDGIASVIDDLGGVDVDYPSEPAENAAISGDGAVLYVHHDHTTTICEHAKACRPLASASSEPVLDVVAPSVLADATSAHHFRFVTDAHGLARVFDPEESRPSADGDAVALTEASLRAMLAADVLTLPDATVAALSSSLDRESAALDGIGSAPLAWRFFHVAPDESLYAPVLELARQETAFPSRFETLATLASASGIASPSTSVLYERYLRQSVEERRRQCTIYFRTISEPGTWIIEYWLYYPFDIGGLGSHLHDPEHIFVEVDKLGGAVRRVIGAGHGYLAGNNVFTTDRPGAPAATLPLFAMVELSKHATATDMDRDGTFTPGVDENEYRERAKIWGVRDVIGAINNQLLAYDRTMTVPRWPEDELALVSTTSRYPDAGIPARSACCTLVPLPVIDPAPLECPRPTLACAQGSVLSHPDFRNPETILKNWVFPQSFLRVIYGLGPRQRLQSLGIGYTVDLDRMPGLSRLMPLPGRVTLGAHVWHQDVTLSDRDSCVNDCQTSTGLGIGLGYEQFFSNLFGIFSAVRVYSPSVKDIWITFGPMVEIPLFNHANVGLLPGLSFRPYASPRFELKVSVGLWKPRNDRFGLPARKGGSD